MHEPERPNESGDAPPEPIEEPANPYAEEDESGTPLTHSELVASALDSLAEHHLEYLIRATGEEYPLRRRLATVDFWTELHATIRREREARPRLAPGAWRAAPALYLTPLRAGSEAPAPTA